jgi:predicted regulator of Ras-like GTPase activity (Roadblock/LC7/MglB family)
MTPFANLRNSIDTGDWQDHEAGEMLRRSLADVPGIRGLLLLSGDGIARAAYGSDRDDAQRIAAASSAMASLSVELARTLGSGGILHTVISMDRCTVVVASAGEGSTLFVTLDQGANIGLAMGEIVRRARAYALQMATPPRTDLSS